MQTANKDARLPMTFEEFWPEYVRAHSRTSTRIIHCIGTLAGWMILGAALALWLFPVLKPDSGQGLQVPAAAGRQTFKPGWLILAALIVPYALAWISHFFIEHNKPATFGHPLWSWWADQRMVFLTLTGKMGHEVKRCVEERSPV
jgi:hypothetical protein